MCILTTGNARTNVSGFPRQLISKGWGFLLTQEIESLSGASLVSRISTMMRATASMEIPNAHLDA